MQLFMVSCEISPVPENALCQPNIGGFLSPNKVLEAVTEGGKDLSKNGNSCVWSQSQEMQNVMAELRKKIFWAKSRA